MLEWGVFRCCIQAGVYRKSVMEMLVLHWHVLHGDIQVPVHWPVKRAPYLWQNRETEYFFTSDQKKWKIQRSWSANWLSHVWSRHVPLKVQILKHFEYHREADAVCESLSLCPTHRHTMCVCVCLFVLKALWDRLLHQLCSDTQEHWGPGDSKCALSVRAHTQTQPGSHVHSKKTNRPINKHKHYLNWDDKHLTAKRCWTPRVRVRTYCTLQLRLSIYQKNKRGQVIKRCVCVYQILQWMTG